MLICIYFCAHACFFPSILWFKYKIDTQFVCIKNVHKMTYALAVYCLMAMPNKMEISITNMLCIILYIERLEFTNDIGQNWHFIRINHSDSFWSIVVSVCGATQRETINKAHSKNWSALTFNTIANNLSNSYSIRHLALLILCSQRNVSKC